MAAKKTTVQSGPVSSDKTTGDDEAVTSAGATGEGEVVATDVPDTADTKGAASMVDDKALEFHDGDLVAVPKEPDTKAILKMDRTDVGDQDIERHEEIAGEHTAQADQIRELQMGEEIDKLVPQAADESDYQSVVAVDHVALDDRSIPHRASIDDPLRDLNNNLIDINNDRLEGYHKIDGDKLLHDRGQLTQQDALEVRNVLANPNEPDAEPTVVEEPEAKPAFTPDEELADGPMDKLRAENRVLADKLDAARKELQAK